MAGCLAMHAIQGLAQGETPLSADERLAAIRRGLVQAAIAGPTRVQASAWVDGAGVLHEASSFQSGMEVRGVRVLSYMRDGLGEPQAVLQIPSVTLPWPDEATPSAVNPGAAPTSACPANAGRLRHLIGLQVIVGSGWTADEVPATRVMARLLGAELSASAAHQPNWLMVVHARRGRSAYERVLVGTSADRLPWEATLVLEPSSEARADPGRMVKIHLSLHKRGGPTAVLDRLATVPLQLQVHRWSAPQLGEETRTQLLALIDNWIKLLTRRLECDPVWPQVVNGSSQDLRINAGAMAGVRMGDEWLLADQQQFPRRILEPGAASQNVMARVVQVSPNEAKLEITAGPAGLIKPGWQAWPTDSLAGALISGRQLTSTNAMD